MEYQDRAHAERAIQQFNGQVFNGRPLAVSGARAREDRGGRGRLRLARRLRSAAAFVFGGPPRPFDPNAAPAAPAVAISTGCEPAARRQRQGQKEESDRPRGPIPLKNTGRSFTLDDADTTADEAEPIDDDFATSKPQDDTDEDKT